MSQEFMDPELFADFIVEAKEHLETIEPNLLELEKTPSNLGLLNEIFRPMHSLKGASGFLGLNSINGLAHKAENILDELRKGNIDVTTEIMDVILAATDALRVMIDNLEVEGSEGEVDTGPIIARIEGILSGTPVPAAESTPAPEVEAMSEGTSSSSPEQDVAPTKASPTESNGSFQDVVSPPQVTGEPYPLTAIGEGHLADFLEEANEIIENLNSSLVELENDPNAADGELVNDIFRYFHNLKGNSGIIGHKELNSLTHEAETLLNKVRKKEMQTSHAMIDLLLAVVDSLEFIISHVDQKSGTAAPVKIDELVNLLSEAGEKGRVDPLMRNGGAQPEQEPAKESQPEPETKEVDVAMEDDGIDPEDVVVFEQTVQQQVNNIDIALDGLRKDPDNKDFADGLYRSLVSVQNSAGYMGFDDLKVMAERTAGLVDQARKSDISFELMVDILSQECSILGDMIKKVLGEIKPVVASSKDETESDEAASEEPVASVQAATEPAPQTTTPAPAPEPKEEPKPAPVPKPAAKPAAEPVAPQKAAAQPAATAKTAADNKPKVSATIRVDHEKLDHLMNLIGELIINRNRYSMLARSLEEGKQDVQSIAQQLTETTYAMARISDDLQDTIMKVRMVPVSTVFSRFPRLVRDLSRKSGKAVNLVMEGEETELDKSVVEVIGDPLVHLIRNSMDHGLETEDVRVETGKNSVGQVWLRAYHRGNSVAIEVEDDGKGIDPTVIREVAVKKGVITPDEAKSMDDRDAIDLIFAPGFSSAEKITDISGRGVGMDVVRTNIKNLKGTVNVVSEVGKGTKFTLTLPLTLAIIDALMVVVAGDTYAIPLDAVSETTKIEVRRMTEVNKRKAVTLRGDVLGIVEMREVLDLSMDEEDNREIVPIVILQDGERRIGVIVDRLLERQEIVIKPLGEYLSDFDLRGVSGATIMGDGSVVLILDPHEIHLMSTSGRSGH
ncbi:chemotaxis protein CheA [Desulfovibrio inopinatus]|uniref:chemotaxis protein CheA n=1 Tax=Desulfovibrio inopinatus TaxID=102109 RepID=UPI00040CBDA0|nr:chemotaxis protein CheA [Desulfovibrio inopinatus]